MSISPPTLSKWSVSQPAHVHLTDTSYTCQPNYYISEQWSTVFMHTQIHLAEQSINTVWECIFVLLWYLNDWHRCVITCQLPPWLCVPHFLVCRFFLYGFYSTSIGSLKLYVVVLVYISKHSVRQCLVGSLYSVSELMCGLLHKISDLSFKGFQVLVWFCSTD